MIFGIVSIFPEMFAATNQYGVVARALEHELFKCELVNPRDFTTDNYRRIDDKTFGGGAGMVMKIQPLELALATLKNKLAALNKHNLPVVYLSPQGVPVTQAIVNQLANQAGMIFVCGRYEGIDERFIERNVDMELSIGDFVVSGGELPTLLLMDAIVRQLPGVLNNQQSALNDSFMAGMLDCPHYTVPRDYHGACVPEVLLSGNHEQIRKWRLAQSLWRTHLRRPDLLATKQLSQEQSRLLDEILSRNKVKGK